MIDKQPFQADGYWWCFRSDDDALDAGALPLGPFFSEDYAALTASSASYGKAPLKIFGKQPTRRQQQWHYH